MSERSELGALGRLRERLASVPERELPGSAPLRRRLVEEAAALAWALAGRRRALPPVRLLYGSSGVGKSTLFNLLTGAEIAFASSVERPASRGAVAAATAEVLEVLDEVDAFPTFDLVRAPADASAVRGEAGRLTLVAAATGPGDSLLVDSPDYDTRIAANREVAERLLLWADGVIFVTSEERYADRSAAPHLARIREAGPALLVVVNKAERPLEADLEQRVRVRVEELGGPEGAEVVVLPRTAPGSLGAEPDIERLRDFLGAAPDADLWRRRLETFEADCRASILDPLAAREAEGERLALELRTAAGADRDVDLETSLGRLRAFEEETKFWLRYSPRALLRGTWRFVRHPRTIFRLPELPPEPDSEEIARSLEEQAWGRLDRAQISAREVLKRGARGREALTAGELDAADLDRAALRRRLAPLAGRLSDFGRERMQRFREDWKRGGGALAKMRAWAVDKVLQLLALALTLTVLPPLVQELLRFIGLPAFANEVEAEFRAAREEFRVIVDRVIEDQLEAYLAVVGSPETARGLRREFEDDLAAARRDCS